MAPLRLVAVLALVAACSSPPAPRRASPSDPAPTTEAPDAGVAPVVEGPSDPTPSPCEGLDWGECFRAAADAVERDDPEQVARGIVLFRALCEEGDRRRCFESDTPDDLRGECKRRALGPACLYLAEAYDEGIQTCPYDTACAAALRRMVCYLENTGASCAP